MNGTDTSTNLTDASGSGGGVGGENNGGFNRRDQQRAPLSAAVATADEESASLTNTDDADITVTTAGLPRVDSLTLALEAIKARQAAAATTSVNSPPSGVDGIFVSVSAEHDAEPGSLINLSSLDPISGSSSSAGGEDDSRPDRPKRASSLKLPRRPKNTMQPQKAVRFADAMGLDLAQVRQVFDLDSPPVIPPEATRDLVLPPSDDEFSGEEDGPKEGACKDSDADQLCTERAGLQPKQHLYLSPSFAQPGSAPNFNSRVTAQKVVLEKAYYHMATPASSSVGHVRGTVRVANLGFEKSVRVRVTLDSWQHCVEVVADFQPGGSVGNSDQFAFNVSIQQDLKVGDRVAFCVVYSVNDQTFWDNNFGDNYSFHCVAINSNSPGLSDDQEQALARYI